jgi:hypothetical protein
MGSIAVAIGLVRADRRRSARLTASACRPFCASLFAILSLLCALQIAGW